MYMQTRINQGRHEHEDRKPFLYNGGDILVAIDSSCINLQSEATVYLKVKKYPGCYF